MSQNGSTTLEPSESNHQGPLQMVELALQSTKLLTRQTVHTERSEGYLRRRLPRKRQWGVPSEGYPPRRRLRKSTATHARLWRVTRHQRAGGQLETVADRDDLLEPGKLHLYRQQCIHQLGSSVQQLFLLWITAVR
eukprot:CAMPEP_0177428578 /NCGR_PEP_ID=MMETSP0368-20130122/74657_1 /TAXON_ID=447022 ORGANISM="Scrippsiella hangoei-like, Strain SHHI-4" /NCGR_SAMPLE_ID=MMETSP0368 /ASSEMBLY_ACC=CAM_ASM_000363 /LENGTH=135 /DNA_ID=CAMNT_0018899033 /DNA_START=34 /DNA_END=438 /DNA_ORIENTATION=-